MAVSHSSSAPCVKSRSRPFRQLHFPHRRRLVIPSTKPRAKRHMKMEQSTLTQLNYMIPSSYAEDDDEVSDLSEDSARKSGPRKRRRLNSQDKKDDVKQSTLTQWEWLNQTYSAGEEETRIWQDVGDGQAEQPSCLDGALVNPLGEDNVLSPGAGRIKQEKMAQDFPVSPSITPVKSTTKDSPTKQEALHSPYVIPSRQSFKTPQKHVKKMIPSSQSPPETLLSTQDDSPEAQRTPLQEIPPNIVAMLDESPLRIVKNRREALSITTEVSIEDKENFSDIPRRKKRGENENLKESSEQSPRTWPEDQRSQMPPSNLTQLYATSPETPLPNTFRSSQATTVDLTQPSPQRLLVHPSTTSDLANLPPSSSKRETPTRNRTRSSIRLRETQMVFESQLPESYLSGFDSGECSPLSSLQESGDIVTISQLLPESMLDNRQGTDGD